ncbi:hypothetical protein GCM10010306_062830 [Streptomyces umbrinus]|uniref:hypothetical protein n=1 Tax=Streptomyces umbrinus TaxID=67370 RepID=UPI001678204D|nr:hypothetical protein [Streptomyces umbrinus]GHB60670.1 hypothetical protein GCM10010306_062830 [Streptomyces umbrinus]
MGWIVAVVVGIVALAIAGAVIVALGAFIHACSTGSTFMQALPGAAKAFVKTLTLELAVLTFVLFAIAGLLRLTGQHIS